jgi:hypothetical protein
MIEVIEWLRRMFPGQIGWHYQRNNTCELHSIARERLLLIARLLL